MSDAEKVNEKVIQENRGRIERGTKEMNYPIIIKDAVGAGSIGLQVCDSFEKAKTVLLENENMSDVMVEEMIQGEPFGTEIHGVPGHYSVLPPYSFPPTTTESSIHGRTSSTARSQTKNIISASFRKCSVSLRKK